MVLAAQLLVPSWSPLVLLGYLAVAAIGAALWTRQGSEVLIALCLVLAGVGQPGVIEFGLLVVSLSLTVVFVRMVRGHRQAIASSRHLQVKADTILDRVADGIIVTDRTGTVLQCNTAGERLVESRSAVGMSCARAVGLRSAEGPLDCSRGCALLRLGPDPESGTGREVWRERNDGRRQSLLASASVVGGGR
ncbi:MAG TPA: hypothetical protein VF711_10655, partial [Acidimicrobiales bacterium]